ncbi:MAG TPA: hypothetical protein VMV94_19965, partial [Phycisphaerae bacterium]|nr:hypothetical protein [Phycisphaerae bacterium]
MPDAGRKPRSTALAAVMRHRALLAFMAHALLFALALFCAFGLYYNFKSFDAWFKPFFLPLLPIVVVLKVVVFAIMRMFRGSWRYVGMRDVMSVAKASYMSTFAFIAAFWSLEWGWAYFTQDPLGGFFSSRGKTPFPQAVFLLDMGMTIATVCGARILVRLYHEEIRPVSVSGHRLCLIVGADDTGETLLREILRMPVERYRVVGFLDDDATKHGSYIHGVPVLGSIDQARTICERHQVEELLLALPNAPQKRLRQIVESLQGLNLLFRTIPAMEAVIEGHVTVSQIRTVDIKDLLGREQV